MQEELPQPAMPNSLGCLLAFSTSSSAHKEAPQTAYWVHCLTKSFLCFSICFPAAWNTCCDILSTSRSVCWEIFQVPCFKLKVEVCLSSKQSVLRDKLSGDNVEKPWAGRTKNPTCWFCSTFSWKKRPQGLGSWCSYLCITYSSALNWSFVLPGSWWKVK